MSLLAIPAGTAAEETVPLTVEPANAPPPPPPPPIPRVVTWGDEETSPVVGAPVAALAGIGLGKITTGNSFACVLALGGYAYCWGAGSSGQLGNGETGSAATPVEVSRSGALEGKLLSDLSAGGSFTCALDSAGDGYCWGASEYVGAGIGDYYAVTRPVALDPFSAIADKNLAQIDAGQTHACALDDQGEAYCWGSNGSGRLGDGSFTSRLSPVSVSTPPGVTWAQVSAGAMHTCAIDSLGAAYCWGEGSSGQLGNGVSTDSTTPVAVTSIPGRTWVDISAGRYHTCGVTDDGAAYCWGWGSQGELGSVGASPAAAPRLVTAPQGVSWVSVSSEWQHTCAVADTGATYCWGLGSSAQLGSGSTSNEYEPLLVTGDFTWSTVAAGVTSTCGISAYAAYCWGSNTSGALGTGSSVASSATPVAVATTSDLDRAVITDIAAGPGHRCVISDGSAYCWGNGTSGQLGNGTTASSATPLRVDTSGVLNGKTLVDIEVGDRHTCAIDSAGAVYCWGLGNEGQLGNASTASSYVPVRVESGGALVGRTVVELSLVGNTSCALTATGTVACWGRGDEGQLGTGALESRVVPAPIDDSNIPQDEQVIGLASRLLVDPVMGPWRSDFSGFCALTDANATYCWGRGADLATELWTPALLPIPIEIVGPGEGIQLRSLTVGYRAQAQYYGDGPQHLCALDQHGTVYCAGANYVGQLGIGSAGNAQWSWQPVSTGALPSTGNVSIAATGSTTCAVDGQGRSYCWGDNAKGQLGDGTTTNKYVPEPVDTNGVLSGLPATQIVGVGSRFWVSTDPGPMPPAAPSRPTATPGNQTMTVAWTAPGDTGGSAITGFSVRYSANSGLSWTLMDPNPAADDRTLTISGLTNGQSYIAQVAAITSVGTGPWSPSSSSVTPATVASAPTSLSAVAGDERVQLSWAAPDDTGGAAISTYEVTVSPSAGTTTVSGTSATVSGLSNATQYTFTVQARNAAGLGAASAEVYATPQGGPNAPPFVTGAPDDRIVNLSWGAPTPAEGVTITGYSIEQSINGGATWTLVVADTQSTARTRQITGLTNGVEYRFRVAALAGAVQGTWSSSSSVITPRTTAAAPTNVVASPGDRRLALSWTEPDNGGTSIYGYRIEYSVNSGAEWQLATSLTGNAQTSYTISGLQNGTAYLVRVAALTLAGPGAWGQTSVAATPSAPDPVDYVEDAQLPAPGSVCPTSRNRAMTIAWIAAPGAQGYVVEYRAGDQEWSQISVPSGTTLTIDGLNNGVKYDFRVASVRDDGRRSAWGTGCVMAWGANATGTLGNGSTRRSDVPVKVSQTFVSPVTRLSAGWQQACLVDTSGQPYCWGYSGNGQLGVINWAIRRPTNYLTQINPGWKVASGSLGTNSTCLITDSDQLKCLGSNTSGQLGIGYTSGNAIGPADVMGVLQGVAVAQVSVGESHACAVTTTGRVACWGNNVSGQVNPVQSAIVTSPVWVEDVLADEQVVSVTAGQLHSCALTSTGRVACWGSDYNGQIGNGASYTQKTPPSWITGVLDSASGAGEVVTAVDAGSNHTCALTDAGRVSCWGANSDGQLGTASRFPRHAPVWVRSPLPPIGIDVVSAGGAFTCASGAEAGTYCWGRGTQGQLGNAARKTKSRPKMVLGMLFGANATRLAAGGEFVTAQWGGTATPGVPSLAPRNVKLNLTGDSAFVTWTRPDVTGSASVSQYRIQRRLSTSAEWTTVATTGLTQATVSVPDPGYWVFRVIPVTDVGDGEPSDEVEVLRLPPSRSIREGVSLTLLTQWGDPVASADVSWSTLDGVFETVVPVRTNASGQVELPQLQTGPIRFQIQGGTVASRGLTLTQATITKTVGSAGGIILIVPGDRSRETRTVTIRMPDGNPVPNAVLTINGGLTGSRQDTRETGARTDTATWSVSGFATTITANAQGQVSIPGLSRRTTTRDVTARFSNGYLQQTRQFRLVRTTDVLFEQMPVVQMLTSSISPVASGSSTDVRVRAVDEYGSPLAGYQVRLEAVDTNGVAVASSRTGIEVASCSNPTALTDAQGFATLSVCPGSSGEWRATASNVVPSVPVSISVVTPPPSGGGGGGGGGLPPGGGGGVPPGGGGAPVDPSPSPSPSPSPDPEAGSEPEPLPVPGPVKPGGAQALVGGEPVEVVTEVDEETSTVSATVGEVSLSLGSRSSDGESRPLADSVVQVPVGGSLSLGLTSLAPESQVQVLLTGEAAEAQVSRAWFPAFVGRMVPSEGVGEVLATLTVSAEGTLDDSVVVPKDVVTGDAVVQVAVVAASGDPVSIFVGVRVEAADPMGSIVIEGSRGKVRGKTGIKVSGVTEGLVGEVLMPRFRFPGPGGYSDGLARRTVAEDGTFSWQRRTGKKIYIIFQTLDGAVKSSRIIIK